MAGSDYYNLLFILAWFYVVCSHQTKGYFNFPVSNHLSSSLQAIPLSWQYSSASVLKPLREKIKPCTCSRFSSFFTSAFFFSVACHEITFIASGGPGRFF
jgi:hypothetical protein